MPIKGQKPFSGPEWRGGGSHRPIKYNKIKARQKIDIIRLGVERVLSAGEGRRGG
jgi:hypothetical protein